MRIAKRHIVAISGIVAASMIGLAPAASATTVTTSVSVQPENFTSDLAGVGEDFQSRRWSDEDYSQVEFTGCSSYFNYDTGVDLREDLTLKPDKDEGTKKYTACFASSKSTSSGEWHGLDDGTYFFQIAYVDDGIQYYDDELNVNKVYVDTTKADS
jgi:hypothetical protein